MVIACFNEDQLSEQFPGVGAPWAQPPTPNFDISDDEWNQYNAIIHVFNSTFDLISTI